MQVLRQCFGSMRENTNVPFELYVLNNGSCPSVSKYLEHLYDQGHITYLIKSQRNVGKVGGWNILFGACQSDIICYTDSDVYFYHDYLQAGIDVLETYPEAGMVTCQPIAGGDMRFVRTTIEAMNASDINIAIGRLIPDQLLRKIVESLGRGEDEINRRSENRHDVRMERNGIVAYSNASHFQFLTRREVVNQLFPVSAGVLLGGDTQFEDTNPRMRWWRLCTENYLVHHIGNVPDEIEQSDPADLNDKVQSKGYRSIGRNIHAVRSVVKYLHAATYKYLYK